LSVGERASEHDVDHDTQTPNITLRIVGFIGHDNLWRHVEVSPYGLLHSYFGIKLAGRSKIYDLNLEIFLEHHIFGFNIAVTNVKLVAIM
jgi:hypothetical protein